MNTKFEADQLTTPEERNRKLSDLLRVSWRPLKIVRIHRTPNADQPEFENSGWLVEFEE